MSVWDMSPEVRAAYTWVKRLTPLEREINFANRYAGVLADEVARLQALVSKDIRAIAVAIMRPQDHDAREPFRVEIIRVLTDIIKNADRIQHDTTCSQQDIVRECQAAIDVINLYLDDTTT